MLKVVLSVIYLVHITFTTTYVQVGAFDVVLAGIPPFNASVANESLDVSVTLPYLFDKLSLQFLGDPRVAIGFPPVTEQCRNSGDSCSSYIFPGKMENIILEPPQSGYTPGNVSNITAVNNPAGTPIITLLDYSEKQRRGVTSYIILNATTYHVEFFPLEQSVEFGADDCRYLGYGDINSSVSPTPVKLCIKSIGEDLAIGMSIICHSFHE